MFCRILSYVGLFVLYMSVYCTVLASLSVRPMVMLHRGPDSNAGRRASVSISSRVPFTL
jgi:hypothetical protein